jgi:hypothetical protein
MKIFIKLIIVLFFFHLAGCRGGNNTITKTTTPVSNLPSNELSVFINIQTSIFRKGQPVYVSTTVQNGTQSLLHLKTIPAFTFNNLEYWCPVSITHNGSLLQSNTFDFLLLDINSSISSAIDISKLYCDRGISSIWPDEALFSIIPEGKYILRLDIEVVDPKNNHWIYSNEIPVEISH